MVYCFQFTKHCHVECLIDLSQQATILCHCDKEAASFHRQRNRKPTALIWRESKNHPDFESPLETALRYTEQSTKVRFLHRKNYLTPSQKPGGKQVCFCLSLLSLWLFKHICYQRLQEFKHSMSRKHQGIPEVSIWPPSMWSWKAHLYQKDGNHLAGFQGAFLALIQFC